MEAATVAAIAFAFVLAGAHVFAGRLRAFGRLPHDLTVSFAGGVSVSYVFVLLLPEVNRAVLDVVESTDAIGRFFSRDVHVYVVVLTGFTAFYGIHALVTHSRHGTDGAEDAEDALDTVFWAHLLSFTGYNGLIGYLLFHQEESGVLNLFFYAAAIVLHFVIIDAGFRRHHGSAYHRIGRWILAAAVLVGAGIGVLTSIAAAPLAVLFAFLAGSVVFNSIKEELPSPAGSRFAAFLLGAGGYTALLLMA
ncbi:hypothetical protein ACFQPA_07650 [Halomarina halobia]|uniref:ZIP family metal transporter n=1 Tax=Halomarina halobia TaxID=3033386 RepID=A0ABD6ABR9_9EURY|nr:hypothetical protein [Halomarina sp. PSR21]